MPHATCATRQAVPHANAHTHTHRHAHTQTDTHKHAHQDSTQTRHTPVHATPPWFLQYIYKYMQYTMLQLPPEPAIDAAALRIK